MNKSTETLILFAIGCIASFNIGVKVTEAVEVTEELTIENQVEFSEALNDIQDMREWMREDIVQGKVDFYVGEYYIEYLDSTEDALVDFAVENGIAN